MPERIGRYDIVEKIGEGGMGVVYKARDPQMSRFVAIKVLKEGFDDPELRERFVQEARAAGNLQNPHIVTVFELMDANDPPFIVMEFLVGDTLDRLIKRQTPMSMVRKLTLMEALCFGLHDAHEHNIVHRDIKPANLMVMSTGMLKILDFGIARAGQSDKTKLGAPMGTFNYMPPEQWRGIGVDRRTDIFAVGAVFYELLSFQKAFPGTQTEAMARVMHSDPDPLEQLCPGLDREIEAIVAKSLKKDSRDRYQDLNVMRQDIVRVRERIERDTPRTTVQSSDDRETVALRDANRALLELRQKANAEIAVARALSVAGDIDLAINRLEQFEPQELVDDVLAELRDRRDTARREEERAQRIKEKVEAATSALATHDYTGAIRLADDALLIDEKSTTAREVRRRARAAIDTARRRVSETIAESKRLFAAGERQKALDLLAGYEPANTEIKTALSALRDEERAMAERERAAREAERRRIEDAASEARRLFDAGERQRALDLLAAFEPQAHEITALRVKLRDEHQAILARERAQQDTVQWSLEASKTPAAAPSPLVVPDLLETAKPILETAVPVPPTPTPSPSSVVTHPAASKPVTVPPTRAPEPRPTATAAPTVKPPAMHEGPADSSAPTANPTVTPTAAPTTPLAGPANESAVVSAKAEARPVAAPKPRPKPSPLPLVIAGAAAVVLVILIALVLRRGGDAQPSGTSNAAAVPGAASTPSTSTAPAPARTTPPVDAPPTASASNPEAVNAAAPGDTVAPPPVAPNLGSLTIDALPWAEVVSVVDASGNKIDIGARAVTPLVLQVAPGQYELTLRNGVTRTVRVQVDAAAAATSPLVEFGKVDAADYFRRLGW